ncbi:MAG: methionyl-tRNA formyltransferase [Alteromonadaceae bacterium]|nr:methionyl-tRNA formyltransferase [Alteromonadaceae bacterium]
MNNYIVATIHPWNIAEFKQYSQALTGNWHLVTNKDDLTFEYVKNINPEYIFFPHWSWLVPAAIFQNYCCVCFHMTDVPFGRGGSPLQNLLVRGIKKTKVSALQMTEQLDAGPVYLKHPMNLTGSAEDIFKNLAKITSSLIIEICDKTPEPLPQSGEVVHFSRRTPQQSEIPENLSTEQLYDFIRMLDAPSYPKAFIEKKGQRLEFSNAKLKNNQLSATVNFTNLALT